MLHDVKQLIMRIEHRSTMFHKVTQGYTLVTELAQLEERSAFNRVVVGSSPIFGEVSHYCENMHNSFVI